MKKLIKKTKQTHKTEETNLKNKTEKAGGNIKQNLKKQKRKKKPRERYKKIIVKKQKNKN